METQETEKSGNTRKIIFRQKAFKGNKKAVVYICTQKRP